MTPSAPSKENFCYVWKKDTPMSKPVLCLDFDGVIHSYESGWHGADVIPDRPVPGAVDFILRAQEHFCVAIFSSRSHQTNGISSMQSWLLGRAQEAWVHREGILAELGPFSEVLKRLAQIEWPTEKPPAFLSIDDRALTFNGNWADFDLEELKRFKPWNK